MTSCRDRASVRLFVEGALTPGAAVALESGQRHYLMRVMRLKSGDRIRAFNGRDGEWLADVTGDRRAACGLVAVEQMRSQNNETGPWLAFAPIKKDPQDYLIAKATELGVCRLCPIFTDHTSVSRVNTTRARAQATEAAEQCGRLTVPEIAEPVPLSAMLAGWDNPRPMIVLHPEGGAAPASVFGHRTESEDEVPQYQACLMTGPEGGWSPSELDAFQKLPFVTLLSLGPRTLRAETAAMAALACLQTLVGDWRDS